MANQNLAKTAGHICLCLFVNSSKQTNTAHILYIISQFQWQFGIIMCENRFRSQRGNCFL